MLLLLLLLPLALLQLLQLQQRQRQQLPSSLPSATRYVSRLQLLLIL